jgi:hypothetical protein
MTRAPPLAQAQPSERSESESGLGLERIDRADLFEICPELSISSKKDAKFNIRIRSKPSQEPQQKYWST